MNPSSGSRSYRTSFRTALALFVFLVTAIPVSAQGNNGGPSVGSLRPVLTDIEFIGNDAVSSAELTAQIETKATSNSALKQVFESYSKLFEKNRQYVPRLYRTLFANTVDSLRGELRYFNPSKAAADTANILRVYNDHGYHSAQVRWDVVIDTVAGTAVLRYLIREGPPYVVTGVDVLGIDAIPENIRVTAHTMEFLKVGEQFQYDKLKSEQDRIEKLLRDNGYPFATVSGLNPTVVSDKKSTDGKRGDSVFIQAYAGERFRVGQTSYVPDTSYSGNPISPGLVYDQIEYRQGEWYSAEKVEQTRANLYALGVFSFVRVDTVRTYGDTIDLAIESQLRQQWDFQSAVEIGAEKRLQGWRVTTGLNSGITKSNVFGRAERINLGGRVLWRPAEGGRFEWGTNAGFFIQAPLGWKRFSAGITGAYDDIVEAQWEATDGVDGGVLRNQRVRGSIEGSLRLPRFTYISSIPIRFDLQVTQYSGVGGFIANAAQVEISDATRTGVTCDFSGPDSAAQVAALRGAVEQAMRGTIYRLQVLQGDDPSLVTEKDAAALDNFAALKRTYVLGASLVHDTRNDFFSPTGGDFLDITGEFGVTGALRGTFAKIEADYRLFLPSGLRSSWAFRSHIGTIFQFGGFPLTPNSSRFSAGGANSIRGWGVRDMLVTAPPVLADIQDSALAACALPILQQIDEESRRLQGGLAVLELSGEFRGWIFELPNTSTINRQLNQLQIIGFVDMGNAYFRDYSADKSLLNLSSIVENIAMSIGSSLGYVTPFGPIRVGFGYPVYDPVNREGSNRWAWNHAFSLGDFTWHLAIGHAF